MRNKILLCVVLIMAVVLNQTSPTQAAAPNKPSVDSKELQLQDMLVLLLLPDMTAKLAEVYAKDLVAGPDLFPYMVDVTHVERIKGFRGFMFHITLHVYPTVGPHISVGEDLMTYQISAEPNIKLIRLVHLKGPDRTNFPPNYLDLLR
ncbi:DUF3888 domain-containing protein [Paenibacillus lignilyticus]|uniref:DUF3888 domain-containing protein n=1 Tax=Paenibacillus lignilyticus TaxID=1172615 RepID=A0ABS5CHE5_9BACL|nr:DUF3888 domain-containing protein [Paenibacillus lignilyticus]MBP3965312.1 DUF3888 domain-containing protein [Paenibacillus lignilyticus]